MTYTTVQMESVLFTSLYREGDLRSARRYLSELQGEATAPEQFVFIANNYSLIEFDLGNYTEALRVLVEAQPYIEKCSDEGLIAKFHLNRASACEGIGLSEGQSSFVDRALIDYEAAAFHFQLAENRDEGCCLNNIGLLLAKVGRPEESHSHLDRAESVFRKRDDEDKQARLAEIDDTRALAYLSQGDTERAVFYASRSVNALSLAGEPRTLIQSIRTLERALEAQEHPLTEFALKEAEGSVPKAAKILQMNRGGLAKRLKKNPAYSDLLELAKFCEKRGVHAKRS